MVGLRSSLFLRVRRFFVVAHSRIPSPVVTAGQDHAIAQIPSGFDRDVHTTAHNFHLFASCAEV
jgi:hypothetical protein